LRSLQILVANPGSFAYIDAPAALQHGLNPCTAGPSAEIVFPLRSSLHHEEIPMSIITMASGLTIEDTVIGEGAAAAAGRDVIVHYAGWLADGTQFDSSKEKQDPFEFTLGKKEVMPGWEEGLSGMKVGGTRKLTIPPQLAYGKEGAGDTIPPNETLTFEVELLAVS
jgi:FKBP-type peptidyl-prolyl cis-trans isomerase FkpA